MVVIILDLGVNLRGFGVDVPIEFRDASSSAGLGEELRFKSDNLVRDG